jgi:hypothetical protein
LGAPLGTLRGTIEDPFYCDAIESDELGDMGRGRGRLKIELNGEDSKKEEKDKSSP